jgi:uncharacterized protein
MSRSALLAASADCAVQRYSVFAAAAQTLHEATIAYAADRTNERKLAARDAWKAAMRAWQEAELFRFGPAAPPSIDPGGKSLRDQIYIWPQFSQCRIDEQTVTQGYVSAGLADARGLGAIEYLLFFDGTDVCSSTFKYKNEWDALSAEELAQRKADYAAAAIADVITHVTTLMNAWDPSSGNFRRELVEPRAGMTFEGDHAALNAVSHALFYIEKEVKDLKVGKPLGRFECQAPPCVDAVESRFAAASSDNIRTNVAGFRRLFQGCADDGSGIGFDDLLEAAGAVDLRDRMVADVNAIQTASEGITMPLENAITSEPDKVTALHDALKALTTSLKGELVTVLNLGLSKTSASDTD